MSISGGPLKKAPTTVQKRPINFWFLTTLSIKKKKENQTQTSVFGLTDQKSVEKYKFPEKILEDEFLCFQRLECLLMLISSNHVETIQITCAY